MSRVRSKDTEPELQLRRALWAAGLRGWRCHVRTVPGTPDLCWKGRKIAVFVDSAWWHGHPSRWTPGRHPPKWDRKIMTNRARDDAVNRVLADAGWMVVRIWDFDLARDTAGSVDAIKSVFAECSPRCDA